MAKRLKVRKSITLRRYKVEDKSYHELHLNVNNQSFKIDMGGHRPKREALWFAGQLKKALAKTGWK